MKTQPRAPLPAMARIAGIAALALLSVATLAGWSHFGTDILLDTAASGLSWCF